MKKLMILVVMSILCGCSFINETDHIKVHETKNPDAEEVLTLEPDADIFQYDHIIYQTHIDWVDELLVTKGEQIGEIETKNELDTNFENKMANKLPAGAKIYQTKERADILIVETADETLKYLAIVEG